MRDTSLRCVWQKALFDSADLAPSVLARGGHADTSFDDEVVFMYGGKNRSGATWTQVGSELVLVGGTCPVQLTSKSQLCNGDAWAFDPAADKWTKVNIRSGRTLLRRAWHVAVAHPHKADTLLLVAGYGKGGKEGQRDSMAYLSDVVEFNVATGTAATLPASGCCRPRCFHGGALLADYIAVFGGRTDADFSEGGERTRSGDSLLIDDDCFVEAYHIPSQRWCAVSVVGELRPCPRSSLKVVALSENVALLFAGAKASQHSLADAWLMYLKAPGSRQRRKGSSIGPSDPLQVQWVPLLPQPGRPMPAARSQHSLTRVADTVYLVGGSGDKTGNVRPYCEEMWAWQVPAGTLRAPSSPKAALATAAEQQLDPAAPPEVEIGHEADSYSLPSTGALAAQAAAVLGQAGTVPPADASKLIGKRSAANSRIAQEERESDAAEWRSTKRCRHLGPGLRKPCGPEAQGLAAGPGQGKAGLSLQALLATTPAAEHPVTAQHGGLMSRTPPTRALASTRQLTTAPRSNQGCLALTVSGLRTPPTRNANGVVTAQDVRTAAPITHGNGCEQVEEGGEDAAVKGGGLRGRRRHGPSRSPTPEQVAAVAALQAELKHARHEAAAAVGAKAVAEAAAEKLQQKVQALEALMLQQQQRMEQQGQQQRQEWEQQVQQLKQQLQGISQQHAAKVGQLEHQLGALRQSEAQERSKALEYQHAFRAEKQKHEDMYATAREMDKQRMQAEQQLSDREVCHQAELAKLAAEQQHLRNALDTLRQEKEAADAAYAQAAAKVQQQEAELDRGRSHVEKLEQDFRRLSDLLKASKSQLDKLNVQCKELQATCTKVNTERSALDQELHAVQQQLQQVTAERSTALQQTAAVEQSLRQHQEMLQAQQHECKELHSEVSSLKGSKQALEHRLQRCESQYTDLQLELNNLHQDGNSALISLEKHTKRLRAAIDRFGPGGAAAGPS